MHNVTSVERIEIGVEKLTTTFGNPALSSLAGLDNITELSGSLEIRGNHALTCLAPLSSLTSIGEDLIVSKNDTLTSLGLDSLVCVLDDFEITDNPGLCSSLARALRDQVLAGEGIGDKIIIEGNKFCLLP